MLPDGHAWVERAVRVLEDHLHLAAHAAQFAFVQARTGPGRRTDLPDVGRWSCRMQRPVVVLPQPLSPTSPSVSPRRTAKLTSSTALTCPTVRWNTTPEVPGNTSSGASHRAARAIVCRVRGALHRRHAAYSFASAAGYRRRNRLTDGPAPTARSGGVSSAHRATREPAARP